jgi:hypothetical protein
MANNYSTRRKKRQQAGGKVGKGKARQRMGGGTKKQPDIRGARRDAERILVTQGPQAAKRMLRNTYDYSADQAKRMVNNIKK